MTNPIGAQTFLIVTARLPPTPYRQTLLGLDNVGAERRRAKAKGENEADEFFGDIVHKVSPDGRAPCASGLCPKIRTRRGFCYLTV